MTLDFTTVLFEIINFLVLMLVLWRLLYRPLRRSIEARRAAIDEDVERARAGREEAELLQEEWRRRETELDALREQTRRAALEDAEAERARLLARAREDADAERARVTQLLEAEREAAAGWVQAAVWSRGTELAGRLALALVPETLDASLWERLLAVLSERRGELVGQDVELVGAHLASPAQTDALRSLLAEALGRAPRLTVREDASLVAGWTVRVGDLVFDGSIAGELAAFRELARELDAQLEGA